MDPTWLFSSVEVDVWGFFSIQPLTLPSGGWAWRELPMEKRRVPVLRVVDGSQKCGSLGTSIIMRVLEESAPYDQLGSIASTAEVVQVRGKKRTVLRAS